MTTLIGREARNVSFLNQRTSKMQVFDIFIFKKAGFWTAFKKNVFDWPVRLSSSRIRLLLGRRSSRPLTPLLLLLFL